MATFGPQDIPVPVSPTGTGATTRLIEASQARLRTELGNTTQGIQMGFSQELADMKREISDKLGGAITQMNIKMGELDRTQHELKESGKLIKEEI